MEALAPASPTAQTPTHSVKPRTVVGVSAPTPQFEFGHVVFAVVGPPPMGFKSPRRFRMNPEEITSQKHLFVSCVSCEETRRFNLTDSGQDAEVAIYDCAECDHTIELDLRP